eukprot:11171428-Lingulodinium_polyedra.AAC.1
MLSSSGVIADRSMGFWLVADIAIRCWMLVGEHAHHAKTCGRRCRGVEYVLISLLCICWRDVPGSSTGPAHARPSQCM